MKKVLVVAIYIFVANLATHGFFEKAWAQENTLEIAVNLGKPWAYYDDEQGVTGIDVETIRAVFGQLGYQTNFQLLGYNRLIHEFNAGKFDMVSPAAFQSDTATYTQKYLPFKDIAISLAQENLVVNSLADLKNRRIVAYEHAKFVLGDDFKNAVKHSQYIEMAQREIQVKLLMNNRTDLVIGEQRLLTYIAHELDANLTLNLHPIFPQANYGAALHDKALAKAFDQELSRFIAAGQFQQLLDKWQVLPKAGH
ncbi:substrate-binding periplasmic protein [Colwellia sp. MEBiC06753]